MKWPRISIAGMMVAVLIVAVDFGLMLGAWRWSQTHHGYLIAYFAFGLVPSVSLLMVSIGFNVASVAKRRETPSFATGYLLAGGVATLVMGVPWMLDNGPVWLYVFILSKLPISIDRDSVEAVAVSLTYAGFALPQVTAGLLGGWLAGRLGMTVVFRERVRQPQGDGIRN